MANEKQQSGLMFNALTAGSKIVGNITADSDYRIDGLVEGDLQCTGKVVIGEAGKVKGTIGCQNAEIMGLLEGKISCSNQLSLRASGKIVGDVNTKTLIVEPGALFNGTCSMGAAKATPSKIALDMSPLVVLWVKPINAPLAFTSLCGLLSPDKYGRKYKSSF